MSISIDSLSSYLDTSSYTQSTSSAQTAADADYSDASDEELMDACKEFEAYFVEQVFKEMEKTIPTDEDEEDSYSSQMVDYFKDEVLQDVSSEISDQGNLGLAEQLYEQMKRNYNL